MENELFEFTVKVALTLESQNSKDEELMELHDKAVYLIEKMSEKNKPTDYSISQFSPKILDNHYSKSKNKSHFTKRIPDEILLSIFMHFKTDESESNTFLVNLSLVNKQWSTVALPLLWTQVYSNHDNLSKLHLLNVGLKLNQEYRKKKSGWFNPNIVLLEFFSDMKFRSTLNKKLFKNLLGVLLLYTKNLKSLSFCIMSGSDRINFNLDDLHNIFTNCKLLTKLEINLLEFSWNKDYDLDELEKKNISIKSGFSKLKIFSLLELKGKKEDFFKLYPLKSVEKLEIDEISFSLAKILKGNLKNLTSLSLTGSLDPNDPGDFDFNAADLIFSEAKNIKILDIQLKYNDGIFLAIIKNNIQLQFISGKIDGRQRSLDFVNWETLSKFLKFSSESLNEFHFTLLLDETERYHSHDTELDDSKLTFISNNLPNLKSFGFYIRNENFQPISAWKKVSVESLKKFLSKPKNKIVRIGVNQEILFGTRLDIQKIFDQSGIDYSESF
ncbi:hypothetical protein HDU92_006548 [Lobulomyces angularis]|nr:hypothetical protein HDU92_006548 [Lobulomyces angularis]